LKRVGVVAASIFAYLAGAGAPEARDLAWEAASNGAKWIAEVGRQSVRLLGSDPAKIQEQYKAALTKVSGAFGRAKGGVESVRTLAEAPEVEADIRQLTDSLTADRDAASKRLEAVYKGLCGELKIKPAPPVLTAQEIEYSKLVPRRKFKVYSEEAQRLSQAARGGQTAAPSAAAPASALPPAKPQGQVQPPAAAAKAPAQTAPGGRPGGAGRGAGFASTSTNYFIDGKRSILEIYNAVRAECGNLQIGSQDAKYAYVLGPEYPDVDLETVVSVIRNLEKTGAVEILPASKGKR
jgi:hypothetical protein